MPMPKSKKSEKKQAFVSRCIATLTKEEADRFPKSSQRAAICYSEWGETPAEKKAASRKAANRKSGQSASRKKKNS